MIFSHRSLRDRDVLRNAALAMLLVSFVAATTASGATDAPAPTVSAAFETGAVHAGATARANVNVIFAEGWHVNAHKPNDEYLIPTDLKIDPPTGIAVRETTYPEPEKMVLEGTGETLLTYGPKFSIGIMFDIAPDVQPGEHTINGVLEYQACDKKQCYPPNSIPVTWTVNVISATQSLAPQPTQSPKEPNTSTSTNIPNPIPQTPYPNADWIPLANAFTVAGDASGYLNATDFIAFLDEVETGRGMAGKNSLVGQTGWLVVVFAIVGGLLLNLTPCVLPLIPINLGIIGAGAKAGSRGRGFLLGGTYGTGIAITYGVLGLVVILGVSKTFGAINATPWFNAGIAIVFTALALAMFDVYLLDFTRFQTRLGFRKGGGHFTAAFVMGAVSALLAGACVAPVIISTIVYAQDRYANGVWAALFLPFLVGVGMALPWPGQHQATSLFSR
ncbi:MAG TPA: cytochrome c biogenesis protein CcdA, partial [Candidatus Hydrogenedentes bacterium]|nr:cytochrome c biogenesis protein CcdA [Candidatus Hydrogenedentota bacterium]